MGILFDPNGSPLGWFSHDADPFGWFDEGLTTPGGAAPPGGFTFTLLDNFNRTGPGLGSNWSGPVDPFDLVPSIIGNVFTGDADLNYFDAYWNVATFGDGVGAAATLAALPSDIAYIMTRISSPNSSGVDAYLAFIAPDGSGEIQRVNNGSYTTLQTFAAGSVSVGDDVALIAEGTGSTVTVTLYSDDGSGWAEVASYADTSGSRLTTLGYGGLGVQGNDAEWNDFGTLEVSTGGTPIEPDLVPSGEAIYTPAVGAGVAPGAIASGEAIYTPSVGAGVAPGAIATGEAIYTPSAAAVVAPGAIASGEAIYTPTIDTFAGLAPDPVASGEVVYAPDVSAGVAPGALASGELVRTPTVAAGVAPGAIASGEAIYTPSAAAVVAPGAIASGEAVYGPTIGAGVVAGVIASGEAIYTPAVAAGIAAGTVVTGELVYTPTLVPGIAPDLVPSGEAIYTPSVGAGVAPGAIASGELVRTPVVGSGVSPALIASGEAVYTPSVGAVVAPTALASDFEAYDPTVTTFMGLYPDPVGSGEVVYSPIVVHLPQPAMSQGGGGPRRQVVKLPLRIDETDLEDDEWVMILALLEEAL